MEVAARDPDLMPPNVSPDDVWGDPVWANGDGPLPAHRLPLKRAAKPRRAKAGEQPDDNGFRIDIQPQRDAGSGDERPGALEVEEINGRVLRLVPEIPAIERVPRQVVFMPRSADVGNKRKHPGETHEWGRPQRHSLLWLIGAGTVVTAMVVGSLIMLPRVNRANAVHVRPGGMELVIDRDELGENPRRMSRMLARHGEAEDLFEAYTHATGLDEVLPMLRDPDADRALLSAAHFTGENPLTRNGSGWAVREINGLVCGLLEGTRADHSRFKAYFTEENGELRMDWKASTGHGTADFSELEQGTGDGSEIRGTITPADFYTLTFPESKYRSYRFVSPDNKRALWVYAKAGDEANTMLHLLFHGGQILTGNKEAGKVALRLAPGPDGAMPNQWLLVELLHKEWIAP